MTIASATTVEEMQAVLQRDLNRMTDSDRNTRKRGIQKILDDIPWDHKLTTRADVLHAFLLTVLLPPTVAAVADPVEKCRELALKMLLKIVSCDISFDTKTATTIFNALCARINDLPFPEPAEELRLLVLQVMSVLLRGMCLGSPLSDETAGGAATVLSVVCKSLQDNFPAAKIEASEIVIFVSEKFPVQVQLNFRGLLKSLVANIFHQHSKVRSITLKALASSLLCMSEDFETVMKDPILPVLLRLEADRSAHTRRELSVLCGSVLLGRASIALERYQCRWDPVAAEYELLAILVMLCSDESDEVQIEAKKQLSALEAVWQSTQLFQDMVIDIPMNAEAISEAASGLGGAEAVLMDCSPAVQSELKQSNTKRHMIRSIAGKLIDLYLDGASGWTTDAKLRNLRALGSVFQWCNDTDALAVYRLDPSSSPNPVSESLPRILSVLGPAVSSEDTDIRLPAQRCCECLGASVLPEEALDLLLARVEGETSGTDTAHQRATAVLLLTSMCVGFRSSLVLCPNDSSADAVDHSKWLKRLTRAVASIDLLEYRELILREALVLLIRGLIRGFSSYLTNPIIQRDMCLCLLFLCGRCAFESDSVPDFAKAELIKLASVSLSEPVHTEVPKMLAVHFSAILNLVLAFGVLLPGKAPSEMVPIWETWTGHSGRKAAFEILIRECPAAAWAHAGLILPVLIKLTKAQARPAEDTEEGITAKYNAMSGHETLTGEIDIRVSMIALMEGWLRAGALDWTCSSHIADAANSVVKEIILPNLIWRSGKVEATVRKVALVALHSLLRAGSVSREILLSVAGELIPAVVSNMDDSEAVPRQLCCFCLDILFTRLRGAFGDESIHQIYPKLLKRLDDSDDSIRKSVCNTFCSFLWCSDPKNYSSTTLDYSLDQFFLHLDDPDESIQEAVIQVILTVKGMNAALVLKKAEANRMSHRSTLMCDRVVHSDPIVLKN